MGDGRLKTALFVIGLAEFGFDAGRGRLLPPKILQQADGLIEAAPGNQGFYAIEIRFRWSSTGLLSRRGGGFAGEQRQTGEQHYGREQPHAPRVPHLRPTFQRRAARYAVPISSSLRRLPVASSNPSEAQPAIVA